MAEWRFGRGWTNEELVERLADSRTRRRNFDATEVDMTPARGWSRHYSQAVIAREPPGPALEGGVFDRAWRLIAAYAFSDPRIAQGHFDAAGPLLRRVMPIEIRVLGLHYLGGVLVSSVRDDVDGERTVRGFRYDTLEGHFERGLEWFLLTKNHASGDVTFTVDAGWQRGQLPNAWSRIGFRLRLLDLWRRCHERTGQSLGNRRAERLAERAWSGGRGAIRCVTDAANAAGSVRGR